VATEEATIPLMVVLSTLVMVLSMVESTWMAFAVQQTLVLSKPNFKSHNISLRVSIATHAEKEHAASTNTVFAGPSDILLVDSTDVRKGTHSYYADLIYIYHSLTTFVKKYT
jgi:hypothetical protein